MSSVRPNDLAILFECAFDVAEDGAASLDVVIDGSIEVFFAHFEQALA